MNSKLVKNNALAVLDTSFYLQKSFRLRISSGKRSNSILFYLSQFQCEQRKDISFRQLRSDFFQSERISRLFRTYLCELRKGEAVLARKLKDKKFQKFLNEPPVPKRKPDLNSFVHRPIEVRLRIPSGNYAKPFCVLNCFIHQECRSDQGLARSLIPRKKSLFLAYSPPSRVFVVCSTFHES